MKTLLSVVVEVILALIVLIVFLDPGGSDPIRTRMRRSLPDFGVSIVAVVLTVAGKSIEVWPGHPEFPSGHMAFTVSLGLGLVARSPRWRAWMLCLWASLGLFLVLAGYHSVLEVLGGTALGGVVGVGGHEILAKLRSRQSPLVGAEEPPRPRVTRTLPPDTAE